MPALTPPEFGEADFRTATASQPNGDCVQVARRAGWVALRDDKTDFGADDDHRLLLTGDAFDRAQDAWRTGGSTGPVRIADRGDGHVMRLDDRSSSELSFSTAEIEAFLDGVIRGEFDSTRY
ncbi:DUF397 domain-containing protein [Pseudonocardia sp. HH130630-07]|uniref:DUF397 domain-containing protein n=1 Tax=Pseudonocardia sp. HH130630-07 TaxID=1690815 RepID=UPI000814DD52|nr:DUF397 domain-containing protein [Pseudonocardia sp. HH130630-07]ANY05904.1 hypothetical protein AFB00_05860 [Pseudonocardia sp. HH130630-07]